MVGELCSCKTRRICKLEKFNCQITFGQGVQFTTDGFGTATLVREWMDSILVSESSSGRKWN